MGKKRLNIWRLADKGDSVSNWVCENCDGEPVYTFTYNNIRGNPVRPVSPNYHLLWDKIDKPNIKHWEISDIVKDKALWVAEDVDGSFHYIIIPYNEKFEGDVEGFKLSELPFYIHSEVKFRGIEVIIGHSRYTFR